VANSITQEDVAEGIKGFYSQNVFLPASTKRSNFFLQMNEMRRNDDQSELLLPVPKNLK
jgi:hypothetical protein